MTDWQPISSSPDGVVVETCIIEDGVQRMEQDLERKGRMWLVPDGSMYVYYEPTHWRPKVAS